MAHLAVNIPFRATLKEPLFMSRPFMLQGEHGKGRDNGKTATDYDSFLLRLVRGSPQFFRQRHCGGHSFGAVGADPSVRSGIRLEPRTEIASAASLNLLLLGVFAPVGGWLIDRFGPRRVIFGSLATIAVGLTGVVFVQQLWQLIFLGASF